MSETSIKLPEIRKTQNWIGGSSLQDAFFIPPEPNLLPNLLSDIEKFLHNEYIQVPELIRAGIAHYQFETIHPFLDGNGRTGRLLIILYLISTGLLNKPVLYISDFFEKNRMSYYDSLSIVKQNDNITQWLKFFLTGVIETSKNSIKTFDEIIKLKKNVENKLTKIGKKATNGQRLLELLYSKPKVNSKLVSEELKITPATANGLLKAFVEVGILQEKTGFNRNRFYVFEEYIKIFR